MKRSCKETRRLLSQYADGELERSDAMRVEEHLRSCPDCRHELAALRALDQIVKEKDAPPKLAEEYWDWHRAQVWKRIRTVRRERQQRSFGQRFFWFRLAVATGGVAVVLIAVVAGWRLLQVSPQKVEAPMVAGEFRTDADAIEKARVPVGGKARPVKKGGAVAGLAKRAEARTTSKAVSEEADIAMDEEAPVLEGRGPEAVTGLSRGRQEQVARSSTLEPDVKAVGVLAGAKFADSAAVKAPELCDMPPEVLDMPMLPTVQADETATVFLRALVETDGLVSQVEVERSSGVELLDSIAAGNVQQARFRPGAHAGRNVRCWVQVEQRFQAEPETTDETDSTTRIERTPEDTE